MKVYTVNPRVAPWYSDEEKWQRLLDATPRQPAPFLVAFHQRQAIKAIVEARKAVRRKRYLRRHSR